ncbi:hypothetical protein HZF24_12000 [Sedimentibacter hydroxybenzoicus DSM 7310]|uniref:Tetratricopeptide repeat-containing protein n=1 Tax=Sedimentibacter hydroxybenzoicus DSM 7310 TaxID=1123245 RepID=A0A974GXA0_SEDHY|nr:hypothetical protein [Sedimentibacter hydroxybenzoicus]NYB74860.1 hypothetical protein [Sedimentibacter hydroxybenzoicus DSM 7310]
MYIIAGILIVLFIYSTNRRKNLEKQVELFNKLLYKEKSPEKYIDEVDKLLLKVQSDRETTINYIQKTTGLLYAGRFDEAIDILNNNVKKIPSNWQVVYYHNLLLSMYFNGEIEKARQVMEQARETLDLYSKKDYNKVTIQLTYAVADFYNGNFEECKDFFKDLIDISKNEYRVAFGYYFTGKILELENEHDKAEEYLKKAKTYGQGSFMESF